MIENYPAPLSGLGEPLRQVGMDALPYKAVIAVVSASQKSTCIEMCNNATIDAFEKICILHCIYFVGQLTRLVEFFLTHHI